MESAYALPAPAKLNMFLQVTGRRADGYHTLRSELRLIELADWIDLESRADGQLLREGDLTGAAEHDLALRAARALREATGARLGATIRVRKSIPVGSGLGGGSSDAATTLIGLNRVWRLGLSRQKLAELALALGADVPFFVQGRAALAEGIGERLTPVPARSAHYAVIWPQVAVSTREIFADFAAGGLTVVGKDTKMAGFPAGGSVTRSSSSGVSADESAVSPSLANDLQPAALRRAPAIGEALARLMPCGDARMSGSGSAVFVNANPAQAQAAIADLPAGWRGWSVRELDQHPLLPW